MIVGFFEEIIFFEKLESLFIIFFISFVLLPTIVYL